MRSVTLTVLLALIACGGSEGDTTSPEGDPEAEWSELDTEEDSSADTGKDEAVCSDDVAEGAPCTGSWEETLCTDAAGTYWWCEDGSWTSKKD